MFVNQEPVEWLCAGRSDEARKEMQTLAVPEDKTDAAS
jgi:hypothetical protein